MVTYISVSSFNSLSDYLEHNMSTAKLYALFEFYEANAINIGKVALIEEPADVDYIPYA